MARLVCATLLLCGAITVEATTWRPPESLLAAVRQIESSNGQLTYGDDGRSLGDFQLSEAAWLDVSSWRKSRGLRTYSYAQNVYNYRVAKLYAADYLALLRVQLTRKLKRAPSFAELYAAYNMGMAMFAQCDFKLSRVNAVTQKRAQKVQALALRK